MIKLQDLAKECGVTDRTIQKHLKNHEAELTGHYQRRGKNGTWLDDEAQEFIRALMIKQPIVVGDLAQLREIQQLQERIRLLEERIERKDVLIDQLQQREASKDKLLEDAVAKQFLLQQKELEVDNQRQRADAAEAQVKEMKEAGLIERIRGWK